MLHRLPHELAAGAVFGNALLRLGLSLRALGGAA